jgi:ribosome-associated heat shock protein Hsp15
LKTSNEIRLDTYLWAIRMFKSRTIASEAIKGGKVKLNGSNIKPSHAVKIGEMYTITISSDNKKIIEVTALLEKRGSFEVAKQHYIDRTPLAEKKDKEGKAFFTMNVKNKKGSGRPTKKDRRDLGKEGGWF